MSWLSGTTAPDEATHPPLANAQQAWQGTERVVAVTILPPDFLTPVTVGLRSDVARVLLMKLEAAIRAVER